PQEAIDADLQQDAGEDDAAGRGSLDVRQRQPSMKRKERHLDRKSGEEGNEDENLPVERKRMVGQAASERGDGEAQGVLAVVLIVPEDDYQKAQERQHAAGECKQEEFDCGVAAL